MKTFFKSALIFINIVIVFGKINGQVNHTDYVDTSLILFWPDPIRAHPGTPIDFRYSYYDYRNEPVTWRLENAPDGMTIDENGKVSWTPSEAGTYTNIRVTCARAGGGSVSREFTTTVGTDDFIFVSPDGNDSWPGTIDSPKRTIESALRMVNGNKGKTIYIREGVYTEIYNWEVNNVLAPMSGQRFTKTDYVEVRGYPGETAVLDCDYRGHGFWAYNTRHVVYSNLTVRKAGRGERGGMIISGDTCLVKDVVVRDSRWETANNCTGIKIQNSHYAVIDRCMMYNNRDTNSDLWNSSNLLVYTTNVTGKIYVMNSYSSGSICGYKIKHAGPAQLVLHNCQSDGDMYGAALASSYSSVRHSVFVNNEIGLFIGPTEPAGAEGMLFEHNTVVNATEAGLSAGNYWCLNTTGHHIRNNIFYSNEVASTAHKNNMYLLCRYASSTDMEITSDYNVFYGLSENNTFKKCATWYSFSGWKSTEQDGNSLFGDPEFTDIGNHDFSIGRSSLAAFGDGEYAGAFNPYYKSAVSLDMCGKGCRGEECCGGLPDKFELFQNYPNPFNPTTTISYTLAAGGNVSIVVYDILSREVAVLVNEIKPTGSYTVNWNGTNKAGAQVGSGIYFYMLKTEEGYMEMKKMLLLR